VSEILFISQHKCGSGVKLRGVANKFNVRRMCTSVISSSEEGSNNGLQDIISICKEYKNFESSMI
jgi:hypothetical protein